MITEDLLLEAIDTVSAWNLEPEEFASAVNRQAQLLLDTQFDFMLAETLPSPYRALRF